MSDNRAPLARGIVLTALAAYVPVLGVSLLVVRIAHGEAWVAWAAFFAASAAIALITYAVFSPRARRQVRWHRVKP